MVTVETKTVKRVFDDPWEDRAKAVEDTVNQWSAEGYFLHGLYEASSDTIVFIFQRPGAPKPGEIHVVGGASEESKAQSTKKATRGPTKTEKETIGT